MAASGNDRREELDKLWNQLLQVHSKMSSYQEQLLQQRQKLRSELEACGVENASLSRSVRDKSEKLLGLNEEIQTLTQQRGQLLKMLSTHTDCPNVAVTAFHGDMQCPVNKNIPINETGTVNIAEPITESDKELTETEKSYEKSIIRFSAEDSIAFSQCETSYKLERDPKLRLLRKGLLEMQQLKKFQLTESYLVPLEDGATILCMDLKQNIVVLGTSRRNILIYDVSTRMCDLNLSTGLTTDFAQLKLGKDEELIITCTNGDILRLEMQNSRNPTRIYTYNANIINLALTPDSKYLFSASTNGYWTCIHVNEARVLRETRVDDEITALELHPNGKNLATAVKSNKIIFWDVHCENSLRTVDTVLNIESLHFHLQGNWLIVGLNGGLELINLANSESDYWSHLVDDSSMAVRTLARLDASGTIVAFLCAQSITLLQTCEKAGSKYIYKFAKIHQVDESQPIIDALFINSETKSTRICAITRKEIRFYGVVM